MPSKLGSGLLMQSHAPIRYSEATQPKAKGVANEAKFLPFQVYNEQGYIENDGEQNATSTGKFLVYDQAYDIRKPLDQVCPFPPDCFLQMHAH